MLLEILEVFENVIILIMPIALVCIVLATIFNSLGKKNESVGKTLKGFFCIFMNIAIVFSVMVIMIFNIYQIAVVWKEYEATQFLEPWIKSISFIAIELVWQFIGVALLFIVWKFVFLQQLIPGVGNVKTRLKNCFKKEAKN